MIQLAFLLQIGVIFGQDLVDLICDTFCQSKSIPIHIAWLHNLLANAQRARLAPWMTNLFWGLFDGNNKFKFNLYQKVIIFRVSWSVSLCIYNFAKISGDFVIAVLMIKQL